mgnify:CR=1 FL=1
MARTITAEQAPSAKPIGISLVVPDTWATIIDAPEYDIPKVGFSSEREIAPGVVEIASSLLLTNVTDNGNITAEVKIVRSDGDESVVMPAIKIPVGDTIAAPVQGQFLLTGDLLQVKASSGASIHATLSVTEGQAEEEITNVN